MTSSKADSVSTRKRPNFSTRTAPEDESRLDPSEPANASEETAPLLHWPAGQAQTYGSMNPPNSEIPIRYRSSHSKFAEYFSSWWKKSENDDVLPNTALDAGPLQDASVDQKGRSGERYRTSEPSVFNLLWSLCADQPECTEYSHVSSLWVHSRTGRSIGNAR
jgi:potassium/chloride transporter 9